MKFLQQIKKFSLLTVAIAAVTGVVFIAFPNQCIKFGSLAVGFGLIVIGAGAIINYFRDKGGTASLIMGIVVLICGIVVCVKYKAIISMLVVIFGIFILTTGIFNLISSLKTVVVKPITGWFTVLMAVVNIVLGIIAIFKSSQLTESIVRFIGVSLIFYCVMGVLTYFQIKEFAQKRQNTAQNTTQNTTQNTIQNTILNNGDIQTDATVIDTEEN